MIKNTAFELKETVTYTGHARRLLSIALPVMLSYLGHMLVGTADSMMVGQLGKVPLAAVALANSIVVLPMTFGLGISYGVTPLVASAQSRKRFGRIGKLLQHSVLLNSIVGILLVAVTVAIVPFLDKLDQPPQVVAETRTYLVLLGASLAPLMVFQAFKQWAEGLGFTRQAMVVSLLANGLNVVLNALLIFGYWGFPELGIEGAGWASLISRTLMAISMVLYCLYGAQLKTFMPVGKWLRYQLVVFRRLLQLGIPMGLQFIFEVGAFVGAVLMAGWISDTAQAAHQIAINLAAITYMIASGLSSATTVQVGSYAGIKDKTNMRRAWLAATALVMCLQFCFAIVFFLGRNWLPTLYNNNAEVIRVASGLLLIAAVFQLSDGVQVVGLGALRGMEDVKIPTYLTLFAYWVIALPLGYGLGFGLGLGIEGIWWGLLTGLSLAAVLLANRFWQLTKVK